MPRMSKRMSRKSGKSRRVKRTSHKSRKILGGSRFDHNGTNDPTIWTALHSTGAWQKTKIYKKQQAKKKANDEAFLADRNKRQQIYNTKKKEKVEKLAKAKVKSANAAKAAKLAKAAKAAKVAKVANETKKKAKQNGWEYL